MSSVWPKTKSVTKQVAERETESQMSFSTRTRRFVVFDRCIQMRRKLKVCSPLDWPTVFLFLVGCEGVGDCPNV